MRDTAQRLDQCLDEIGVGAVLKHAVGADDVPNHLDAQLDRIEKLLSAPAAQKGRPCK